MPIVTAEPKPKTHNERNSSFDSDRDTSALKAASPDTIVPESQSEADVESSLQMAPNPQPDGTSLNGLGSPAIDMAPSHASSPETTMQVEEEVNQEESEEPELAESERGGGLPDLPPEDEDEQTTEGDLTKQKEESAQSESVDEGSTAAVPDRESSRGSAPEYREPPGAGLLKTKSPGQSQTEADASSPEEPKMMSGRPASEVEGASSKKSEKTDEKSAPGIGSTDTQEAPAGTGKKGAQKAEETPLETGSSRAMMKSLTSKNASGFVSSMKQASKSVAGLQDKEKKELQESLPEIDQPTGLPTKAQKKAEELNLKEQKAPNLEATGEEKGKKMGTQHKEAEGPAPAKHTPRFQEPEAPKQEGSSSWWNRLFNRIKSYLKTLPESDSGVRTSAGDSPDVDLSGKADPKQNKEHKAKSDSKIQDKKAEAQKETNKEFGENDIHPNVETKKLSPDTEIEGAAPKETKEIPTRELDPEVRTSLNNNLQSRMDQEVAPKNQEFTETHQQYESDSSKEKKEGLAKIEEESDRVKAEQEKHQQSAKQQVSAERKQWRKENENVKKKYEKQSSAKKKEIDQKIDSEVKSAEKEADNKLEKAEQKAEQEKKEAERKARKKKREAKNKPRSFWDRVKGAVSDFFEKIRSAINAIFEGLRKLVKKIIETAKKVVKGIIELARRAVVGLIKKFGEVLKKLVSVALAAFPELAKKARAAIDKVVNKAVETVNKAARALKEFADKVLDAIGKALDFIITVYQKAYNAILDALEFIALGLIEVMEAIANLVAAAKEMPNHFWDQMLGELFGVDEPLPFEKTSKSERTENTSDVPQSEVPASAAGLLSISELGKNDISVENVAVIDFGPEMSKKLLNMSDGEEQEFEGAENPITMRELQQSAMAQDQGATASGPGDAGRQIREEENLSTDEQLDKMIENIPSTCEPDKNAEPAKSSEFPESAKIGPLAVSQRLRFVMGAMKKGIATWWECNKVTVIAAIVGLLLGAVILNIITGGAVMAAIPPLLKILAAYFIAEAIYKTTSYFGTFFKEGIAGNINESAKGLARALAILAIELVFAVVFELKAILKALKGGLKSAIKSGAKAAKASIKSTGRAFKELGNVVVDGGKAAIKNGKLVFKGVKSGFARGAKSMDDLIKRLIERFRLKKFKIKRNGLRFSLFGNFNPWVLLATGKVEEVDDDVIKSIKGRGKIGKEVDLILKDGEQTKGVAIGAKSEPSIITDLLKARAETEEGLKANKQLFDDYAQKSAKYTSTFQRSVFKSIRHVREDAVITIQSVGGATAKQLDDIMKNTLRGGPFTPGSIIDILEIIAKRKPTGFDVVLRDLAGEWKKFKGARFVLKYMDENASALSGLSKLEAKQGARVYDAIIDGVKYEFKNWESFSEIFDDGVVRQLAGDFRNFGGTTTGFKGNVKWVFSSRIGSREDIMKGFKRALSNQKLLKNHDLTPQQAGNILDNLEVEDVIKIF